MASINLLSTALVTIDVQEKLAPAMTGVAAVLDRVKLLLRGAGVLGVDVMVTEQYPKGLGVTLPEVAECFPAVTRVTSKSAFSVFLEPAFRVELAKKHRDTLVFCGIEAHVCVYQSALDALDAGFQVLVASDAVTSRRSEDATAALAQLRAAGAEVVSAEAVLFRLLRDSAAPEFKAISKLVR